VASLRRVLEGFASGRRRRRVEAIETLSPEQIRELRALGYLN
jgi:hypothetical protein